MRLARNTVEWVHARGFQPMRSRASFYPRSQLTRPSLVGGGRDELLALGVFGAVSLEMIGPGEGLSAVCTLVRRLSAVHVYVLGQLRGKAKCPATLGTEKALFPGVDLLVPL